MINSRRPPVLDHRQEQLPHQVRDDMDAPQQGVPSGRVHAGRYLLPRERRMVQQVQVVLSQQVCD